MLQSQRGRRLRKNSAIRDLVAETRLDLRDFIYPLFLVEGEGRREPIGAMPGIDHFSIDEVLVEIGNLLKLGLDKFLLFGIPDEKDALGSQAYAPHGIIQEALRAIRARYPEAYLVTDVCLCEYTDHGHCGVLTEAGEVLNDPTLDLIQKTAVSHAEAGADMVAPSGKMDGDIQVIREALDAAGYEDIPILGYSAKFASNYYGPFREAADSAPQHGDRKAYQMDYRNQTEALRQMEREIQDGVDILMVKPALAYLDVVALAKQTFNLPLCVYNVSGEYSLLKQGIASGLVKEDIIEETLLCLKRAGADMIITYHAKELAQKWAKG